MRRKWMWFFLIIVFLGFVAWVGSTDLDFMASPNRIGVLEVRGAIADVRDHIKAIKRFRKDPNMKAVLLRIDSPGGGIAPSQELYREIKRTTLEKPVIVSMGAIAASGGYYIAAPASRIISNPGTITGSIGVISYFPNVQDLLRKIGVQTVVIKSGALKDVGNPGREMTAEEKVYIQGTIDEAHRQFIRDVAEARKMSEEKVRSIADGRIFMGETALQLGLVDELGNLEDAVIAAASMGGIVDEPELIYARKEHRSLLDFLLGDEISEKVGMLLGGSGSLLRYQLPLDVWPAGPS